jgi:hypothetical protein
MSSYELTKYQASLGDIEMNPAKVGHEKPQSTDPAPGESSRSLVQKKPILISGFICSLFVVIFAILLAVYLVMEHKFRSNIDRVVHVRIHHLLQFILRNFTTLHLFFFMILRYFCSLLALRFGFSNL